MALFNNGITLTWLGHGTFYATTPEGQSVLLDAWVDGNPACPDALKPKARENLEAIFLTHGHFDHTGDLVSIAQETGAKIVCQFDLQAWLVGQGIAEDQIVGFNTGGTVEVAGIQATMTGAVHSSSAIEDGKVLALGTSIGYILRFSNGYTIYMTGDTAVTYDMLIMGDLYQPDLVLLPIGDYFTMGPRQAAYALKLIRARHAVGYHWGTFPLLTGTPAALQAACTDMQVDTNIIALQPGEYLA